MSELGLVGVCKSYGSVTVLSDIDLTVKDGEFVVFVGPSGCGKSTLLRMIAGLDRPTKGALLIDGTDVTQVPAADRGLAMVFQSYALYPHMTVRQNLAFGLENSRLPRPEIDQRIQEAARMLEISDYLGRRPGQLSGGQRQRVAIGRAIVRRPGAFLLDEPLSNLDAELRVSMRAELAALQQRLKATMIYVTHDQVEAMTMADRIVVLRAGRIEQVGTPLELYNHPANRFVAGFIGAPHMNFLTGTIAERNGTTATVRIGDQDVRIAVGDNAAGPGAPVSIGVRPHHVTFADRTEGIGARVRLVEELGSETVVHLEAPGTDRLVAVLPGQRSVAVGETVHAGWEPSMIHAFDADGRRIGP